MAKPIQLSNGRTWPTQRAALDHFKAMLARYQDDERVDRRMDHLDLVALLDRFDLSVVGGQPKTGAGARYFMRRLNIGEGYSSSGFWLARVDDEPTDFSYIAALKGAPRSDAKEFYDTCAATVRPVLAVAKSEFFAAHAGLDGRVPCEISDEMLLPEQACVDHAWPTFGQIVGAFRVRQGWATEIPISAVRAPRENERESSFEDLAVAQAFRDFHRSVATLRVISLRGGGYVEGEKRRTLVKRPVVFPGGV
jgi:hypothetical protein